MKELILFLFIILINHSISGQSSEEFERSMTLTEFWETVFSEDTTSLRMENIYVTTKDEEEQYNIRSGILSKKKTVNKKVYLENIYFKGYYHELFRDFHSGGFNIDSTTFNKPFHISLRGIQGVYLNNCTFLKQAHIELDDHAWLGVQVNSCKFDSGYFFGINGNNEEQSNLNLGIENSSFIVPNYYEWFSSFNSIYISNSEFKDTSRLLEKSKGIYISNGKNPLKYLSISNSKIEAPLRLNGQRISETFNIESSELSYLAVNTFKLPQDPYEFKCKWNLLDSTLSFMAVTRIESENGGYDDYNNFYNLYSDTTINDDKMHDELKSKLYQIHNIYRVQGDIESANYCYRDIKKFENKRWKYLYNKDPSFEKWFHWRLNELISFYSDYGTNPAKAVIKSFWVILFFTLFYMFFPSEWDISSKSAIIANFKKAADKEQNTAFPIFRLFVFLVVGFANAFTLSLNSFVTLGFGQIPTKGIARYITILQGFIGWFLLTIFSVSLINQVLN